MWNNIFSLRWSYYSWRCPLCNKKIFLNILGDNIFHVYSYIMTFSLVIYLMLYYIVIYYVSK